jgi:hypothetical protein
MGLLWLEAKIAGAARNRESRRTARVIAENSADQRLVLGF